VQLDRELRPREYFSKVRTLVRSCSFYRESQESSLKRQVVKKGVANSGGFFIDVICFSQNESYRIQQKAHQNPEPQGKNANKSQSYQAGDN